MERYVSVQNCSCAYHVGCCIHLIDLEPMETIIYLLGMNCLIFSTFFKLSEIWYHRIIL